MKLDASEEPSFKEDLPQAAVPKFHLIQQSDENGCQVDGRTRKSSWLASLCNCFKSIDSSYRHPKNYALLEPQNMVDYGKNTLVLDLDETLVHSSFTTINSDITLEIQVDRQKFKIFVLTRPGLADFLQKCCESFEVVIFTASLSVYADPLLDILDPNGKIAFRLFRESCAYANGTYVKDLSRLGRDLKKVIIVDPDNAIPIKTWMDDKSDKCLEELWEVLKIIANVEDVPKVLGEVKERMNAGDVGKAVETIGKRAEFNSPVNAEGRKFRFDDN